MSSIKKLLEMKGAQDFLPINDSVVVEGGGHYMGYEYLITFTHFGTRCGYIALHEKDLKDKGLYDNDAWSHIDCHGGVTFFDNHTTIKCVLNNPSADLWIGFDTGHGWDGKDIKNMEKYFSECEDIRRFVRLWKEIDEESPGLRLLEIKNYDYLENECKKIIDQLIEKEK